MKQSTKLLSLVLALVMAFSCMTVIGNAALVKSEVTWDSLDDAALAPEQVADIALDLVDNDLLAGLETIEIPVIGNIRLNSISNLLEDIVSIRGGFVWSVGSGLLKNIGALDFAPINKGGDSWGFAGIGGNKDAYGRDDGDLVLIGQLLEFIGNDNNSEILSRVAYGIGDGGKTNSNGDLSNTAQLNLGLVSSFLDLGEIGEMLNDLPKMVTTLLYDMLVYGSYGYPDDAEELNNTLPTSVDTLDEMVDLAILNLLTLPQQYEWEGEGDAAVKVWDESSVLLPSLRAARDAYSAELKGQGYTDEAAQAACADFVTPLSQSIFGLLDFAAQYAIDDLGISALNGNLKKALMEAVEIDLNEIPRESVDAAALAEFDKEDYVTYIGYDSMEKGADGNWYYTTLKTEVQKDATGNPVLDDEGNEITERVRKYYKANMASANEFAPLINWDWEFVGSTKAPSGKQIQLLYNNIKKDYDGDGTASIVEGLNDLIGLVYDAALTDAVKADFTAFVGNGTGFVKGANSNLMTNINNIAKYLLVNHGDMIFGSTSPYSKLTKEELAGKDTVDLVAMIGPGFFEDVMPQLIMPKNADGTYAFHDGVQIYEFGALIIREFMSDITPNINYYDQYIFAEGTVTSANDRHFKTNTVEQWFNLILNMGLDIAYTYLYNITNFGDEITLKNANGTYTAGQPSMNVTKRTVKYPELTSTNVYTNTRWMGMLDEAIMWAVKYVGVTGNTSVINGMDATTISGKGNALGKLSYILNTLLPLGFINGYSSATYAFDVELFLNNGLKAFFTDFDLARVAGLFGRNMSTSHYNLFADANIATAVLDLVNDILNLVFRGTILQGVNATGLTPADINAQSMDAIIQPANLKKTVAYILRNLYKNKDALLINALPVVGKLIKGWGTEQAFQTPQVTLSRTIDLTNGATSAAQTVTVRNASNGVWRHYYKADGTEGTDNQYQIQLTSVAAYDGITDNKSTTVSPVLSDTQKAAKIDAGATGSFTYTVAGVPTAGDLVRFEIKYKVYDELGNVMSNGKEFVIKSYAWLNYNPTDANKTINHDSELLHIELYTPQYVPLSNALEVIPTLSTSYFGRDYKGTTNDQTGKIINNSGAVDGLTFASLSQKFANSDKGRYLRNIRNFDNYTGIYTNEDGTETSDTIAVSGGINEAAWKAANKTSGSKTNFSITLSNSKIKEDQSTTFSLIYYDDVYYNKLSSLANKELDAMRLAADYNLTGTVYADGLLTTANSTDDMGTDDKSDDEIIFRDSNFTATAWIDADKNAYAESSVTDIATTTDESGKVTAATGYVTVDGEKVAVKKVTAIDCATAINNYVAAFEPGIRGGMQAFNANTEWNFKTPYEALYVAANDISYCKKTTEQVVAEGNGDNIDGAVETLKQNLDTIEAQTTDIKNYTDYKMWRLNRLNDARDDARYYINLKNDASNATVDEIDESFPYTWIEEDDLRALVALKKNNAFVNTEIQTVGGTDNKNLVLALLEPISAEEKEAKAEWLEARKTEYATRTLLDVEMASNYLTLTSQRLLPKYDEVITTYLDDELTSAENMIGIDGDIYADGVAEKYTERSWAKFVAAYENAIAVYDNLTQKNVFDAKWELQCCRNELVLVEDEANYSDLEALIKQAEFALANQSLYDNTAQELGQVLAELGLKEEVVNADGDVIDLFPGSAYYINSEPYDTDDQDVIDQKATELKEALARLKFKGLSISATQGNDVVIGTGTLVADDKNTPDVDETVKATIATIAAEMNADAVKGLFNVTATGATVGKDNITVSNDLHYTIDTDLDGFAGTSSVVTFYTLQDGVKIPVATVKIIVNADINGDGAVDVLDGAYAQLVSNEKAELSGCYFIAGNLDLTADAENNQVINAEDYKAIVNVIVA